MGGASLNLKLLLIFSLLASLGFATSGSGNISTCLSSGWDYCTINQSSTLTGTDFALALDGLNISEEVTITLNYSRLNITATEYINVFGTINGSGTDGIPGRGGFGGSGGGACTYTDQTCSFAGAANGSNGSAGVGGAAQIGYGSGYHPFESTTGSAGSVSHKGGGFYATGYCYAHTVTSGYTYGYAGGSGQAIYLNASTINVSGRIFANAGNPLSLSGGGTGAYDVCGGSGGGEITLRADEIYISGNISANGSDAYSSQGTNSTSGGDGGRITLCSPGYPTITGNVIADGGTGMNGGDTGTRRVSGPCSGLQWNVNFNCSDEMSSMAKNFTATIMTGNGEVLISSEVYNYSVVPSGWNFSDYANQHPTGIYQICYNGTTRYFNGASTGSYNINGYSLNQTLGSYYAFTVKNSAGAPLPGTLISAYRYNPNISAYVVVEQAITDSGGIGTLYLQPLIPYRMNFEASGYSVLVYDFLPSTTSSIMITINSGGSGYGNGTNGTLPQPMPGYQFAYGDISYDTSPNPGGYTNATNITYTISSAGSLLEYWGMTVRHLKNGSNLIVYTNNLTTPSGGTMNWTTNDTGTYIVSIWFKIQNHSQFNPLPFSFSVSNTSWNSFFNTRDHFLETEVMSGWVFYFVGLVCAMLSAGFISRYSYEGASWAGLIVLWGFTMFNPGGILFESEVITITAFMATVLATVGVVATTYLMKAGA